MPLYLLVKMEMDTKSMVVETFAKSVDLTVKQASDLLRQSYGRSLSYHGVYKSIKHLNERGVLEKRGQTYRLSLSWAKQQLEANNSLQHYLKRNADLYEQHENHSVIYEFDSFSKAHEFIRATEVKHFTKGGGVKSAIWITKHCYNYLLQPGKEIEHVKDIVRNNNRLIIINSCDTALDVWTQKAFMKQGAHVQNSGVSSTLSDLCIYDSFAIQIFYGPKFREALDILYEKTEDVSEFCVSEVVDMLEKIDYKICIAVYTNPVVVKSLSDEVMHIVDAR